MDCKLISVVIPCYRSAKSIDIVIDEIEKVVFSREGFDVEIICVNDHSPDELWELLKKRAATDEHIIAVDLARNFGQHAALMAGYRLASGDYIFSFDDDGEAPVDAIYQAIDMMEERNCDAVIGSFDHKNSASWFRAFGSYCAEFMERHLTGKPDDISMSTFRLMRPFVKDEICRYEGCYPFVTGLLFRTTLNCVNLPIHHRSRITGQSGYTFSKLLSLWLNGFTAFSVKPLRLASALGFFSSCVGFIYALVCVIRKMLNPSMLIGYASLMSVLLIVGGIIMLMLGLIGEYLGRVYICLNKSPQYVIREIVGRKQHRNLQIKQ